MSYSVGTYNIAKPNEAPTRHLAAWSTRRDKLVSNIAKANLDILCLQELSVPVLGWWKDQMEVLGYGLCYHSCKEESGVGIIYKKDKFNLTGEVKSEFSGDNGQRNRALIQLDLQEKASQKVIRVASMHLYGGPDKSLANAQIQHFRGIIETNAANISQTIMAGDFNSDGDDEINLGPCRILLEQKSQYEYRTVKKDSADKKVITTSRSNRKLDWIFVGDKSQSAKMNLACLIFSNLSNGASDHYLHGIQLSNGPIASQPNDVEFKAQPQADGLPNGLKALLTRNGRITRQDVMDQGYDKRNAGSKIKNWLRAGILIQQGHGKDTIYLAGSICFQKPLIQDSANVSTSQSSQSGGNILQGPIKSETFREKIAKSFKTFWEKVAKVCLGIFDFLSQLFLSYGQHNQHRYHQSRSISYGRHSRQ